MENTSKYNLKKEVSNKSFKFNINVKKSEEPQPPSELYGYNTNLNKFRSYIDNIDSDSWKKVRWYINKYDFLVKDPIINRAFYKYWEILNDFEIYEDYTDDDLILHCAEAPGGFIQGTNIYLQVERRFDSYGSDNKDKNKPDEDGFISVTNKKKKRNMHKIYSISLNKDLPQYKSYNLPSYNKGILNKHVLITYGKDKTGDINNIENIEHIYKLSKQHFYLITADGGFDEGTDFNNKEQLHYKLILSEIYAAIYLQKFDGHFIVKVFDIFTETSIHILYLLSICWKEIYIYKPKTSRPTNSEKYIVCKFFDTTMETRTKILSTLKVLMYNINNTKCKYVSFKLFDSIPSNFIETVKDANYKMSETQCFYLNQAIELCKTTEFIESYDKLLEESLESRRSIFNHWEQLYNLNSYV
jgi:23S rRNA U2552 (ribose-2'-O)-methylase RlmE/FtsJ